MSKLFHATGIVLCGEPYREADRSYHVFTKEYGKLRVIARGGSKLHAKLTPHMEMPAELVLSFAHAHTLPIVIGVERHQLFPVVCRIPERLSLVQQAFHFVDAGTKEEEIDLDLYQDLFAWLTFVEQDLGELPRERRSFLLASFALKLLSRLGYHPQLQACLHCNKQVSSSEFKWHAVKGGVVCTSCTTAEPSVWSAARPMDDDTLKLLRFSLSASHEEQLRPRLPTRVLPLFHSAVESLFMAHFPIIPNCAIQDVCS